MLTSCNSLYYRELQHRILEYPMHISKCLKYFFESLLFIFFAVSLYPAPPEPKELAILKHAYPDVSFTAVYDAALSDFKIDVVQNRGAIRKTATLYWADGKMLPADKLTERESYWPLLYPYAKEIPDPANFSEEDLRRLRNFSSAETRSRQGGTSLYFFNTVYDCETRQSTEAHIKRISFLGKYTNAHERIFVPLARVENKIRERAKTDAAVQHFIDELARVDSYNWREIGDRASRSFHSYGIAIDVLPRGWGQKNIYWAWRRDIDPDGWMTLPLEKRWMPPDGVIEAFESEGFIWGGKWPIWDNMHFEYHPELIAYSRNR